MLSAVAIKMMGKFQKQDRMRGLYEEGTPKCRHAVEKTTPHRSIEWNGSFDQREERVEENRMIELPAGTALGKVFERRTNRLKVMSLGQSFFHKYFNLY